MALAVALIMIFGPIIYVHTSCSGGDTNLLSYYGGVAGGILTIAGVFFTVAYSRKQYENDQRNAVIPYFAVNMLKSHYPSSNDHISDETNNNDNPPKNDTPALDSNGYYEYKAVDYVFIIQNGSIKVRNKLTDDQKSRAEKPRISTEEIMKGVTAWVASDDVYQTIDCENVGNGPAVNFRIGFYRKDSKEKLYSYSISVRQGEHVTVHIYAENCDQKSKNLGSYELEIHYEDIFGNKYIQTNDIIIAYGQRGLTVQSNMYQEQKLASKTNVY